VQRGPDLGGRLRREEEHEQEEEEEEEEYCICYAAFC